MNKVQCKFDLNEDMLYEIFKFIPQSDQKNLTPCKSWKNTLPRTYIMRSILEVFKNPNHSVSDYVKNMIKVYPPQISTSENREKEICQIISKYREIKLDNFLGSKIVQDSQVKDDPFVKCSQLFMEIMPYSHLSFIGATNPDLQIILDRKKTVLSVVQEKAVEFHFLSRRDKNDKAIAMVAIKQNALYFKEASIGLRDDWELLKAAIGESTFISPINAASSRLQNDFCIQCYFCICHTCAVLSLSDDD